MFFFFFSPNPAVSSHLYRERKGKFDLTSFLFCTFASQVGSKHGDANAADWTDCCSLDDTRRGVCQRKMKDTVKLGYNVLGLVRTLGYNVLSVDHEHRQSENMYIFFG